MRYRSLGNTGVKVSPICLGTMMFGAIGNRDHDDCVSIIRRAIDAGVNFLDTADIYSVGESEEIVGKAIAGRRDDLVIATKFHNPMGDDVNQRGNSRRWIVRAVEDSLRRLGTDHIDLYQVHRPDANTDVGDTLSALDDLVRQGKIRYAGSSTFPADAIVEARWVAEKRGLEPFRTEQPPYSIFTRGIEERVMPVCEQYGMGVIPWSPLASGMLTGRYQPGQDIPKTGRAARIPARFDPSVPGVAAKLDAVPKLEAIAADAGISLIDMALAFTLAHPAVSATIIGPRTMEQLEGCLGAADVKLTDEVLDAIDEIVPAGTNLNAGDAGWVAPAVAQSWRRRRPYTQR